MSEKESSKEAKDTTTMRQRTDKAAGKTETARVDKTKRSNLVYLGPTIPGVMKHSTVFQNGILPGKAQECLSEFPAMNRLFVSTEKMAETVKELHKQQSALRAVYAQVEQKILNRR